MKIYSCIRKRRLRSVYLKASTCTRAKGVRTNNQRGGGEDLGQSSLRRCEQDPSCSHNYSVSQGQERSTDVIEGLLAQAL